MKEINSAELKNNDPSPQDPRGVTDPDQEDDERTKLTKALLEMENKPLDTTVKQV